MNEFLIPVLVLVFLIAGSFVAGHIMGWLMEHRLLGVAILAGIVYWAIVDLETALWVVGVTVGILLIFASGGREGHDRGGFRDDDGGG